MGIDVFISYHTSTSSHITKAICNCLESSGIRCWYAPRDTVGSYANSIANAISECKVFVVVLNREASFSEDVLNEMNLAFERVRTGDNIAILPFHISAEEISNDAKYYLGRIHWIDAINPPIEERINELKNVIMARLGNDESKNIFQKTTTSTVMVNQSIDSDVANLISRIPLLNERRGYMFIDESISSALMIVDDSFQIKDKGTVIVGRILRGSISLGDELEIVGLSYNKQLVTVAGIEYERKLLDCAGVGAKIGLLVKIKDDQRKRLLKKVHSFHIERGQVIAHTNSIQAYSVIECQVRDDLHSNEHHRIQTMEKFQLDFGHTDITGTVENIFNKDELIKTIVVKLCCPIALEKGYGFRILNGGECIGAGIVTKLIN